MATLQLNDASAAPVSGMGSARLRDWLGGRWAVLFSNPEDFAPHPSTPDGFITLLADDFAACGAKPISLANEQSAPSWLDYAGTDSAKVVIGTQDSPIVDLAERTLAMKIERLDSPFVIVMDANARCRTTITYDSHRPARTRTIQDVLTVVQVLQRRTADVSSRRYQRAAVG